MKRGAVHRFGGTGVLASASVPLAPATSEIVNHQGRRKLPLCPSRRVRESFLITFSRKSNAMRRAYFLAPSQTV